MRMEEMNMKKILCLICVCLLMICSVAFAEESEPTVRVTLADSGITVDGTGAEAQGSVLTITLPGVYELTGSLSNGQIVITNDMTEKITLILNGVSVTNEEGPALFVRSSPERVTLTTTADTENTLASGEAFRSPADGDPDAAVYSTADLTISGKGILNVTAARVNGIVSKDDLKIKGGTLNVKAGKHGIRGKDFVEIYDGVITIDAVKDGIRSTNTKRADRGYVEITGGSVSITCGDDPIQAVTRISVSGAAVNVTLVPEKDD